MKPEITSRFTDTSLVDCFTVKFEYNEYRVTAAIDNSLGEKYLLGITISPEESEEKKRQFVFDVSRVEHLHLAAKIYERVCELLEDKPPVVRKARPSKVSGKQT